MKVRVRFSDCSIKGSGIKILGMFRVVVYKDMVLTILANRVLTILANRVLKF